MAFSYSGEQFSHWKKWGSSICIDTKQSPRHITWKTECRTQRTVWQHLFIYSYFLLSAEVTHCSCLRQRHWRIWEPLEDGKFIFSKFYIIKFINIFSWLLPGIFLKMAFLPSKLKEIFIFLIILHLHIWVYVW